MGAIANDWLPAVQAEFGKPYYRELYKFVTREYANGTVYPPAQDIFNALHLTPLSKVKAVILGQDPYHGDHQAHGLCFSVQPGTQIPPSLVNIYKELHDDLGCRIPDNGCLTSWAEQGVLLLNTVLTVRAHQANSHRNHGWEQFTDAILQAVNAQDRGPPIPVHCPPTEGSSDAAISASATGSSGTTAWIPSTGRSGIFTAEHKCLIF